MDFTWPMSGGYERGPDMADRENSAMDFMVSAWSLLRGSGEEKGEKKSIASASLAAAGGGSQEKAVDFVKHSWALYQQAMDEGWVTDWVSQFTKEDVFLCDNIGRPAPYTCHGQEELCAYYNTVLERVWDNGRAMITWTPHTFYSLGRNTGVVMAEFDVDVVPKGGTHSRQLWMYHVQDGKLAEIRMYPLAEGAPHRAPCRPPPHSVPDYQPPPLPTYPPPTSSSPISDFDAMSCVSVPSYAESMPRTGPVGVALTRPCMHNSWDNVRIKRGWAILRCRICQSQWRLRPTTIPHCADFARGAGVCPAGVECAQLHVHRTRESSELKRQMQQSAPCYTSTTVYPAVGGNGDQQLQPQPGTPAVQRGVPASPGTAPVPKTQHPAFNRSLSQGIPSHPQLSSDPVPQQQQALTYDEPYRGEGGS